MKHSMRTCVAGLSLLAGCAALPPTGGDSRPAGALDGELQRALASHRWTLVSAADAGGRPVQGLLPASARPVVLGVDGDRLHIQGGCNRLFGDYRLRGGGLTVANLASTRMACEPAAMRVDAVLAGLLAQRLVVAVSPGPAPTLRLVTPAGVVLGFEGRASAVAARGVPTRIFLEVAAQTVPCARPPAGARACLQVRERRYDAQGLLLGPPGAWQVFAEPIEGYVHEAGVRQVLRIQRFERAQTASGAPFVYVLDLVVESEARP
jgi:heat shock protein HslJ